MTLMKANRSELNSGMMQTYTARSMVKEFKTGNLAVLVDGTEYIAKRNITSRSLTKGMKVAASYNKYNQGWDVYEVLGFTGHDGKYGKGGVKYDSAKELLAAYDVKSFKQLEAKQDDFEYGHASYLVVRDLHTGESGAWFYLFEGRWCLGSGAEALSFVEVEEFDSKAYEAKQQEENRQRELDYVRNDIRIVEARIAELTEQLEALNRRAQELEA